MTDQRRSEMAGRRLSSAMRAGDMRATELLYRGPNGYGRGFGPPNAARTPGFGMAPQPPQTSANNSQPLPPALDPLANLPPPATMEEALGMPSAGAPAAASGQAAQVMTWLPPLNMPWQGQPLPGGVPMGQLPPSTLMGGTGVPPPPEYSEQQVGGFNVLTGPDGKGGRKFLNAFTAPERGGPPPLSAAEMGRIRSAGMQPTQVGGRMFDAQGVPYLEPLPQAPVPTERVTEKSADGTTTRTYTQPRGAAPTAAPATAQDRVNKLMEKAGIKPTASTQTGQMPNANYAAPLRPEQMLEEARNEYARTGSDAALKQYFAQYPSEAVRFNQQEQKIWQQIGEQSAAYGRAVDRRAGAQTARERAINDPNRNDYGAMGAGSEALLWEAQNPQAMALSAPLPPLDMSLFERARRLNAQAQAARQGMPVPAGWADDPGRVPAPPPLPTSAPQRPFWQTVGMGANAMMNDLSQLPGQVAAYGRNNPLLTIRR